MVCRSSVSKDRLCMCNRVVGFSARLHCLCPKADKTTWIQRRRRRADAVQFSVTAAAAAAVKLITGRRLLRVDRVRRLMMTAKTNRIHQRNGFSVSFSYSLPLFSLSLSPSASVCLCLSLSVSVSLCLSLFLCLPFSSKIPSTPCVELQLTDHHTKQKLCG